MNNDQVGTLGVIIAGLFFILIIIAALDTWGIWQAASQYKDLKANCPCYTGTRAEAPVKDYCGYYEVCNGTISGKAFNPITECISRRLS